MRLRVTIAALVTGWLLFGARATAEPVGPALALACAPTKPDVAAAMIGGAVWTTADGGATWTRLAVLPAIGGDDTGSQTAAEWLATDRPVLPRGETLSIEDQHRITAPDLSAPSQDLAAESASGAAPSRPLLAVGDDGAWIAARGNRLFIGGPGHGVRRTIDVGDVRGLAVDGRGAIWVAVDGALLLFGSTGDAASPARRFPLAGAGWIVTDAGSGRVLVPAREGLAVVDRRSRWSPALELERGGPVAAVAVEPGVGLVLAARGRILRRWPDGRAEDLGPAPGSVARLFVDRNQLVWILDRAGRWSSGTSAPWRVSTAVSLAVDAAGRVWIGSQHGVRPPGASTPLAGPVPTSRSIRPGLVGRVTAGAARMFDQEVGRPPCRKLPIDLLPRTSVLAGLGQGSTRQVARPHPDTQTERRTWVYLEIGLGWTFGWVSPADCSARIERHAELVTERRNRAGALMVAWQKAEARKAAAQDLTTAIDARIKRDQLTELIRIISGVVPREEAK